MDKWHGKITLGFWPIAAFIIVLQWFEYSLEDFVFLGMLLLISWIVIYGKKRILALGCAVLLYVITILPLLFFPIINRQLLASQERFGETFLHGVNAVIKVFMPYRPYMVVASTALLFAVVSRSPFSRRVDVDPKI